MLPSAHRFNAGKRAKDTRESIQAALAAPGD
jgi:hypothetical protein